MKVFLLIACLVFLAGCKICTCKQITCTAFDDALFNTWAPYQKDELLVFKNDAGVADTILIVTVRKSEAYQGTTGGGYGCGKGCFADASIYGTNMSGEDYEKFSFTASKSDPNGSASAPLNFVGLRMNRVMFQGKSLTDTGFTPTDYSPKHISKFSSSLTLSSKQFTNVQMIMADTSVVKLPGVYKVYLQKGKGLVAWESYPQKTLWVRE